MKPTLSIAYCTKCRWLTRATWIAQELLITFPEDFERVSLVPSEPGTFTVHLNDQQIFNRKTEGRFPEPKELKQSIRDHIDPQRELGHSDRKSQSS